RAGPRQGRCGDHAGRPVPVDNRDAARARRGLDRLFGVPYRGGEVMRRFFVLFACAALLTACSDEPEQAQYGASPNLPEPQRGLLPDMKVAPPAQWHNELPTVPEGYTIAPIATDLAVPRQTLVLPN